MTIAIAPVRTGILKYWTVSEWTGTFAGQFAGGWRYDYSYSAREDWTIEQMDGVRMDRELSGAGRRGVAV